MDCSNNLNFSVGYYQDFAAMDADFQASIVREERRCRYPSKRCEFPRAIKRNGEMHRFCDAHRSKANLNQRRLEARRKREIKGTETPRKRRSLSSDSENSPNLANQVERPPWSNPSDSSSPPLHSVLAHDELNFLSDLLSQNSLEDLHAEFTDGSTMQMDSRFSC
ncbi:hypothetical protein PHMEG_00016151 [Phytophthora megakarya]|uniref:Uncharacterized protein n=1 Tax=Phytophthora megakarya TaxID=4795 RepID=A0A225W228_9STRA|nr:hypothetical protein PHMEG_00016151 [Phytophthora megakarya]